MNRREQLQQAAIEINMALHTYPTLLDRLVAVGEWADANPINRDEEKKLDKNLIELNEKLNLVIEALRIKI